MWHKRVQQELVPRFPGVIFAQARSYQFGKTVETAKGRVVLKPIVPLEGDPIKQMKRFLRGRYTETELFVLYYHPRGGFNWEVL